MFSITAETAPEEARVDAQSWHDKKDNFTKLKDFFVFVVMFLSCTTICAAGQANAQIEPEALNFEYTFQDSSILHPSQLDGVTDWKLIEPAKMSLKPIEGKALWLKARIARSDNFPDPVVKFFRLQEKFSVFVDGQKKFSFGEGLKYAGLPVHLISLPAESKPFVVFFRVESSLPLIGPRGGVFIGSRAEFVKQLIVGDLTDFFVVSVLALLGLAGFILYSMYRHVRTYLHLGGFAVSSCLYFIGRMPSKIIFGIDPVWSGFIGLWGLYATPFFFLGFFREIFSIQSARLLTILTVATGFFLAVAVVVSFLSPAGPLDLLITFYPLAVVSYLAPLFYAVIHLRKHPYVRTFFIGVCLMFIAGLWEAAREFRLFRANIPMITWGFFGFILSLVAMQGQFFAALFKISKHNEKLAEDARRRLERVLACTRALARTRNYKELIRVVADALLTELQIADEDVSVDFFMPATNASDSADAIHQFSYIYSSSKKEGHLYEVSQPRKETGAGETNANKSEKISSLPGISSAAENEHFSSNAGPASVLTIPLLADDFVGAVAIRKYSKGSFEFSDFSLLNSFVNSMSASLQIALRNLEYVDEVKAKVAMENELDAAMSLQAALLPEPLELPGIQYSAYCKSAGKTGGDWHGYYFCKRKNRLFLTIGDVTGHDFAASIMTGLAAGAVKAWEEHDSHRFEKADDALEDLARLVNRVFCASNRGLKFMSMFFACIDLSEGEIHVVNAGHPHPFLFSLGKPPTTLHASGHLLGQNPESNFHAETHPLTPGDSVFFYTDGLFENHGEDAKCLSRRALLKSVSEIKIAHEMLEAVLENAQKIWGQTPPDDDVTLVAVTWLPNRTTESHVA